MQMCSGCIQATKIQTTVKDNDCVLSGVLERSERSSMHCLLSTLSSWISIALQPGGCFIKRVYQTSQAYFNYFEQNQQTISQTN